MDLIDRIRSQSNNPAAIPQDDDPVVPEYDGNMQVEGLGGISDLRDQYDLGPISDNEDDENAPAPQLIRDLRDDPHFDTGPNPESDADSFSNETIETGTGTETEDDDDDDDDDDEKFTEDELKNLDSEQLHTVAEQLEVEDFENLENDDLIEAILAKQDTTEYDPAVRKDELMKLTRDELTTLADELKVEGAVAMPNKEVIADAIIEAESEDNSDNS